MVGHHFVEQIMNDERYAITVIGAEPRPAYDRVHLSAVFDGSTPADLALTTREAYEAAGIEGIFGEAVTAINREQKTVTTALGRTFAYDKLILATGSYPFVPPVPGHDHHVAPPPGRAPPRGEPPPARRPLRPARRRRRQPRLRPATARQGAFVQQHPRSG